MRTSEMRAHRCNWSAGNFYRLDRLRCIETMAVMQKLHDWWWWSLCISKIVCDKMIDHNIIVSNVRCASKLFFTNYCNYDFQKNHHQVRPFWWDGISIRIHLGIWMLIIKIAFILIASQRSTQNGYNVWPYYFFQVIYSLVVMPLLCCFYLLRL